MYVVATSRSGLPSIYGPFPNVAEAWQWAQDNLEVHGYTYQDVGDPRGHWNTARLYGTHSGMRS